MQICTTLSCADVLNPTHLVFSAGQQKLSIIIMQMLIHPACLRHEQQWLLSQLSQANVILHRRAQASRSYLSHLKPLNGLNYAFIKLSESECISLILLCPKPLSPPKKQTLKSPYSNMVRDELIKISQQPKDGRRKVNIGWLLVHTNVMI